MFCCAALLTSHNANLGLTWQNAPTTDEGEGLLIRSNISTPSSSRKLPIPSMLLHQCAPLTITEELMASLSTWDVEHHDWLATQNVSGPYDFLILVVL
jgi:hypothetical protein